MRVVDSLRYYGFAATGAALATFFPVLIFVCIRIGIAHKPII
jgi:hypothetical protein